MTLVQLRTFRRLAQLRNFTRTAEDLDVTQSAVTQQIQALQRRFETPLFDFARRAPELTDAGAFLAERCAAIVDAVDALDLEMREFAAARAGTLSLGATVTIGTYALPAQIAAFRRGVTDADVRVTVANTANTCAALKARRIAVALVEGSFDDDDLASVVYAGDRLRLIVPRSGHRFSARRAIALEDLRDEPLVVRERGSGTRKLADDVLAASGVSVRIALELPNNEGVVRAVEAGLGVALLSELAIARDVGAGTVRVVDVRDAGFERVFRIVRLRSRTLSPLAEKFVAFLLA